MQLDNRNSNNPSIIVNKANSDLSYSEIITITKGKTFANMTQLSYNLQGKSRAEIQISSGNIFRI